MRSGVFSKFKHVVAGAAVVSLALAGCSAGGEDPSVGSTSELSETSTTTLPPLEYEVPPQYPEGLEIDSPANAGAFVQFAIETLNYAQRFNDIAAVDAISVPECVFCESLIEDLMMFEEEGSRRVGTELSCSVTAVEYQDATGLFFLDSDCSSTAGATYSETGEELGYFQESEFQLTWVVTMINGPWQLVNAGTTMEETP